MGKKFELIKKLCGILLSVFVLTSFVGNIEAFAYSEVPDYLDFGDCVVSINAGESKEVWLYAHYDYTYYLGPHTSKGTYCEGRFKSGTGTLKKQGNIAMLYNAQGIAMASFSLTKGAGNMASLSIKGVANNGSNYFDVTSDSDSSPVISESDKAVMLANGYAGVCVNGKFKNWP